MHRWPRKAVQFASVAFLVGVPMLNYAGVLYQQYGLNAHHTVSLMASFSERLLYRLFLLAAPLLPDPAADSIRLAGGYGYLLLGGLDILDPVVALETLVMTPAAWPKLLLGAALTLGIAALIGRAFCGWICPVNTVLEGVDALRRRALPRLSLRPWDVSLPRWAKWTFLAGGLASAAAVDIALWTLLLPHVQLGRELASLVIFGAVGAAPLFFVFIILLELLFSRRAWCRCLCPTGALLGWAGSLPLLKVRKENAGCLADCAACARACPMALDPANPIAQSECLNCGLCVGACPASLLRLLPAAAGRPSLGRQAGVRTGAAALALALALGLQAAPAAAHHMRGQPHYGYAENYPQTPTRETRGRVGKFVVNVVSYFFQGLRRERSDTPDDVQFYVNLQDAKTLQSYTGPLRIEVWREGKKLGAFERAHPLEEAAYRVRLPIPGPGEYELRLSANGAPLGALGVNVEADKDSWTPYLVALLLAAIFTLYLANRRRPLWPRRRMSRVARGA